MSESFYTQLSAKFNDATWVPVSLAMPNMHSDFTNKMMLPLKATPITPKDAKSRFVSSRTTLHLMHSRWLLSGSGKGMIDESVSQEDIYKIVDCDNCQDFLVDKATYILYLWELAWTHQILDKVTQTLSADVTADGSQVPQVSTSPCKKKMLASILLARSSSESRNSGDDMKKDIEASILKVHSISIIQALLESKQREHSVICKQLSCTVEMKTNYEIQECTTNNEQSKELLRKIIIQYEQNINEYMNKEDKLKKEISQLQEKLEKTFCLCDMPVQVHCYQYNKMS